MAPHPNTDDQRSTWRPSRRPRCRAPRRARAAGITGAVGASAILGACSGFQAPRVELVGTRLVERSAEAGVYEVTLRATNPNDESMPLREVNYRLAFDAGPVVTGGRSPEATVPAFGTVDVRFPAVVPSAMAAVPPAVGTGFALSGELVYVSPGEFADVLFDAGVSRPTVPLNARGRVEAPRAVD